jgi:tape measure domain-containing protein
VAQANVKLTVDASQATRALKGVQAQSTGLQNNLGKLKAAFAGVAFTAVARQAVNTASNFQALQLRMKVLTSEFGEFAGAQELVAKAQDRFNLSIVEATKGVTDIFARLRPLGISLKDIETTFIGFNTIAKLAGLNATEASAAFTQLAQGLGSGRLQGDEFRSIAEQVPQLLKAISDETGIASGKLKDFASKGLLKSDIILRALAKSADEGADKIGAIMDASPAETFKAFNNAVLELQLTLGDKLLPVVLKATKGLTELVEGVVSFVDSEAGTVTFTFIGIAAAIKGIAVVVPIVGAQIAALKAGFIGITVASKIGLGSLVAYKATLAATSAGFATATAAATAFKIAIAKTGIGLLVIGLGFVAAALMKANAEQKQFNDLLEFGSAAEITRNIEEAEAKVKELQKALEDARRMGGHKGRTTRKGLAGDIQKAKEEVDKLKLSLEDAKLRDLSKEFEMIKKNLTDSNASLEKNNKISKELTEEAKIRKEHELAIADLEKKFEGKELEELKILQEQNLQHKLKGEQIKKNAEEAKKLKDTFKEVGDAIESNIKNNLKDAITGAQSFGDAMSNVLNSIRDKIIDIALESALGGIGDSIGGFIGKIFKRERGGPVTAGGTFLVGEKGPEILQMGARGGTVIPNSKIGGESVTNNIVVNVDATGTAVQGDDANANQFGEQLAAAIQAEIINQKRSGGLLS